MKNKFEMMNVIKNKLPKPMGITREYAVLVPLIIYENEVFLLFEERGASISQPGEVSFPGGKREKGESLEETAIRETMEELSCRRDQITVIGQMNFIVNHEKSVIYPFIGFLDESVISSFQENKEVKRIFTRPLSWFLNQEPKIYQGVIRIDFPTEFPWGYLRQGRAYQWNHGSHSVPFYENSNPLIWGYTARMIHELTKIWGEENEA